MFKIVLNTLNGTLNEPKPDSKQIMNIYSSQTFFLFSVNFISDLYFDKNMVIFNEALENPYVIRIKFSFTLY